MQNLLIFLFLKIKVLDIQINKMNYIFFDFLLEEKRIIFFFF